jgi:hypothetical protein
MAEFKEALERLTERIVAERRRMQSQAKRPASKLQNILVAQRRAPAATHNGSRMSATSK